LMTLADESLLPPTFFWLPSGKSSPALSTLSDNATAAATAATVGQAVLVSTRAGLKRNVDLMLSAERRHAGEAIAYKKQCWHEEERYNDMLLEAMVYDYDEVPETISPSQVFRLPSVSSVAAAAVVRQGFLPEPLQTPHISVGVASVNASGQVVQYGKVGRPPLVNEHGVVEKRYMCPVPGCGKIYKNPNGLKYHNENGHLKEGEVSKRSRKMIARESAVVEQAPMITPPAAGATLAMTKEDTVGGGRDDEPRPYVCHAAGCAKAYKNSGGLKYHLERVHMDGNSTLRKRQSQPQSAEFQRSVLEKASLLAAQAGIDVNTVELPKKGNASRSNNNNNGSGGGSSVNGGSKTLTAAMAAALMQSFVSSMNY